jgi:hypothetical protein
MVGTPPEDDVGHKVPINAVIGNLKLSSSCVGWVLFNAFSANVDYHHGGYAVNDPL